MHRFKQMPAMRKKTDFSEMYTALQRPLIALTLLQLAACAAPTQLEMMPTPALYQDNMVDPFAHLPLSKQSTSMEVFYATGRNAIDNGSSSATTYGNTVDSQVHFGRALVSFGEGQLQWDELHRASLSADRSQQIAVHLDSVAPMSSIAKTIVPADPDTSKYSAPPEYHPGLQSFFDAINAQLAQTNTQELLIYVHGTKVDFLNAVTLTAEIDHFTAREFVSLAYDWPSHQNILDYVIGVDKERAINASYQLKNTLILLAEHTNARKINLLCYSAGGRVTSRALHELRQENPKLDIEVLKARYRIGTVVFAAADVEVDRFLERLPDIASLSDQTLITISDADNVLENARKVMGGADRVGSMAAEDLEKSFISSHSLRNVAIVDVSLTKDIRGFDIEGHHYWYRHPWMSSDILFLLLTDQSPERRGLSPSKDTGIWYFSPEYPAAIRQAAQRELSDWEVGPAQPQIDK
jgi:esterase/lipase superfamily enzyme